MSTKLALTLGDITHMDVDAIVNAANTSLLGGGGGGVDGAIHRAAGPHLLEECRRLHGCNTGQAKMTKGYDFPARHVIHAVGPIWRNGEHGEAELLKACYENSLRLALDNDLKTLAFSAISIGVYSYPLHEAAAIAIHTTRQFCTLNPGLDTVYFVLFSEHAYNVYQETLNALA